MNEYYVEIHARRNDGFLPDFVGHTDHAYIKADSAEEAEKQVRQKIENEMGMEIFDGTITVTYKTAIV